MTADVLPMGEIAPELLAIVCTVEGTTVTTYDDQPVSLDHCAWVQTTPCGCIGAITMAVCGDDVVNSAAKAFRFLADSAQDAKETEASGHQVFLIKRSDYKPVILPRFGECTHVPQWGVKRRTKTIDGVTFSRVTSKLWWVGDGADRWRLERDRRWYLYPPHGHPDNRVRYAGSQVAPAMVAAAKVINEATS